jgi:hypothetical protein
VGVKPNNNKTRKALRMLICNAQQKDGGEECKLLSSVGSDNGSSLDPSFLEQDVEASNTEADKEKSEIEVSHDEVEIFCMYISLYNNDDIESWADEVDRVFPLHNIKYSDQQSSFKVAHSTCQSAPLSRELLEAHHCDGVKGELRPLEMSSHDDLRLLVNELETEMSHTTEVLNQILIEVARLQQNEKVTNSIIVNLRAQLEAKTQSKMLNARTPADTAAATSTAINSCSRVHISDWFSNSSSELAPFTAPSVLSTYEFPSQVGGCSPPRRSPHSDVLWSPDSSPLLRLRQTKRFSVLRSSSSHPMESVRCGTGFTADISTAMKPTDNARSSSYFERTESEQYTDSALSYNIISFTADIMDDADAHSCRISSLPSSCD